MQGKESKCTKGKARECKGKKGKERNGKEGKECKRMQWNGMEWNGMERIEMEWDGRIGKERDGYGFYGCSAGPPLLPRPDPPHAADPQATAEEWVQDAFRRVHVSTLCSVWVPPILANPLKVPEGTLKDP